MNKRILYVIGSLNVGGAERHIAMVSSALREHGWLPEILCLAEEGELAQQLRKNGILVHTLTMMGRPVQSFGFRPVRLVAMVLSCFLFLRRHRPDIVHLFLPAAYIVGGLCAWAGRISPRIMSRRSLNHYQQKRPVFAYIERWLHSRMTLVVGNSQAVIADLIREGVPESKLQLIYNGINLAPFEAAHDRHETRVALGVQDKSLMIVVLANLIPYKGHEDLIRALGEIKDRLPANWRVVCVGRDDGIGASLKALAISLGVESKIVWAGPCADVPAILGVSDIGVLCSHEEGFSNAILESMAAALPMIVTDVGGNAEAVLHGETGLVVPPQNPEALGAAILKMILEMDYRKLGYCGRERIQNQFSQEACVCGYEDLYRQALALSEKCRRSVGV